MRNLRPRRDLVSSEEIKSGFSNDEGFGGKSFEPARWRAAEGCNGGRRLGVLGILIVGHGPWNKPKVQPAFMASYSSTGEAARAVGAKVMPTEPRLQVEPEPPCRSPFIR